MHAPLLKPQIPQPQHSSRGGKGGPRARAILIGMIVGGIISTLLTLAVCSQYARENLYTQAEMRELVSGFATMVSDMAYRKGRESCRPR